MNDKIDFIILWVDGSDEKWLKEKEKYMPKINKKSKDGKNRYRDWDLLKYWFRGIEKYAPWVNRIHFVTYGHLPKWLDVKNPKLNVVRHEDIIPKKYLPTYNSNVIQYYLHKIEGLTERFVLFDDDFFIIKDVKETDFFNGNKIKSTYGETPFWYSYPGDVYPHSLLNNLQYINKYYSKKEVYKKNPFKYFNIKYGLKSNIKTLLTYSFNEFTGIDNQHFCYECTKKNYELFWKYCKKDIELASNNKFREPNDLTTLLVKYIALLEGNFTPRSYKFGTRFELGRDNIESICNAIKKQKYHIICINDSIKDEEFEETKNKLINVFEEILPNKSNFEK